MLPPQLLLNILKFITFIIIVFVTISFPISCRKIDFSTDKILAIERNKFFSLPTNVPPVLERIVNDMKRQDAIKPFVHNFIKNTGYPAWQHAKINISRLAYQSAEPESDTLVTVPIVKEGASYLSGVLAILVNSEV
ncbi:MAG: hypothetical protein KF829_10285 [Ferruginibacter sp.]|nr:hypothetical protein [Ferruginibacter sp.]